MLNHLGVGVAEPVPDLTLRGAVRDRRPLVLRAVPAFRFRLLDRSIITPTSCGVCPEIGAFDDLGQSGKERGTDTSPPAGPIRFDRMLTTRFAGRAVIG